MWYTDGIQIFKSSKNSIWGFFLAILELPYIDRFKIENVLLVSLWYGDKKPSPEFFLGPLMTLLKELYRGVNIFVRDIGETILI